MSKVSGASSKSAGITINADGVPEVKFAGDWNIRDIIHVKRVLGLRYREYINSLRKQTK